MGRNLTTCNSVCCMTHRTTAKNTAIQNTAPPAAAIVLAGGQGTRIRHLFPDVPKPMVPAAGRPFLELVLRWLGEQSVERSVVSLGHLAGVVEDYLRRRPADRLRIKSTREPQALGTGGAVAWAAAEVGHSELIIVANGDSLLLADLTPAWRLLGDDSIDGVIVGLEVADAARYGRLQVDTSGRLLRFAEKQPGSGLINGGVYLLRRSLIDRFPRRRPLSMETDVFPALLSAGARLAVYACRAPFLDIGTPESVTQADHFIQQHFFLGKAAA